MHRRSRWGVILGVLGLLTLAGAGCGQPPAEADIAPARAAPSTATARPPMLTPAPTFTPASTATTTPTTTPVPTLAPTPAAALEVRSDQPRAAAQVIDADLAILTAGNATFAVDLYHALRPEPGNLFVSPHSISVALAMTYAGAASTTAEQMRSVLHFSLPPERLHPAFNALDTALEQRAASSAAPQPDAAAPFRLENINAVWAQQGYSVRPAFLDLLATQYGAGLRLADFATAPEAARTAINAWVGEQTAQRLPELLPPGAVTPNTRMALVNAIYFNAQWQQPFSVDMTADAPFRLLDGTDVSVPMMGQATTVGYSAGPDYQAVQLAYQGDASMLVLQPAAGRFADWEAALTAERITEIVGSLEQEFVYLTLPKLDYTSASVPLKQTLQGLGMRAAFAADEADFSGMDGTRQLFIGEAYHQAWLLVNEDGTEAAATVVLPMTGGGGAATTSTSIR